MSPCLGSSQSPGNCQRGFTLIELLTVIAIIGILAAILIPVAGTVRQTARSSLSASHLRQWGVALQVYAADSGGVVPYEGSADNLSWNDVRAAINETAWFNVLPPYVDMRPMRDLDSTGQQNFSRSAGIHLCPLVEWRDGRRPNFSYMMNSQIYHPDAPGKNNSNGNLPNPPILLAHIQHPSLTVAFADANSEGGLNQRARGRGSHVDSRHRGGTTNLVFFDGSVRRFEAAYLRQETYSSGGATFSENNKPDVTWNPWRASAVGP